MSVIWFIQHKSTTLPSRTRVDFVVNDYFEKLIGFTKPPLIKIHYDRAGIIAIQ